MSEQIFLNDIFYGSHDSNQGCEEAPFLDISQLLFQNVESHTNMFHFDEQSPAHDIFFQVQSEVKEDNGEKEEKSVNVELDQQQKPLKCKSMYNKNVCFNICQKTIKVIKKGHYDSVLDEICREFEIEKQKFRININKIKKDFTGPKALARYIEGKTGESMVFGAFMKWFLAEKYLRHALIEGQMKDVKVYIEYKNEVILPLLQ